jgi:hypothetical protein
MAVYKRYQRGVKLKRVEKSPKSELQNLWEERIVQAEREKQKWIDEFRCETLEFMYYGHQMPDWWSHPETWFSVNLIYSAFKILKRNVVPKNLEVVVRPRRTFRADRELVEQLQVQSGLRQAVLQYWVEKLGVEAEARMAYLSAMWAFGCAKVGYNAVMEDNENVGRPVKDKQGSILWDGDSMVLEPDKHVVKEDFFVDWVDYECLLVDRDCSNNPDKTARWIAHKIFKPVEEVKKDPMYKNTGKLGPSALEDREREYLKQDDFKTPMTRMGRPGPALEEDEVVVLYEIYDMYRGETITIARDHNGPIRGPEDVPQGVGEHPFIFLKMAERRGSFYPIPAVFNWMGPQLEYNVRRNMMALHLRRYGRKYIYYGMDDSEMSKLEEGVDGTYAKADDPSARVEPIKDAPLDSAQYFDTGRLRIEFDEMSGVGALQRNVPDADSATEAEIVERRAREGESDDHEAVMEFISAIVTKLHKCIEANLTMDGAVQVTGPAGESWVFFGPEDFEAIEGEFVFEVKADAQPKDTLMVERAQLLQFLEMIAKNPLLGASDTLLRAVAEKFPAVAHNEALIQEVRLLAIFQLQMNAIQGGPNPSAGSAQPKGGSQTRPREVSEQSRKVAAK